MQIDILQLTEGAKKAKGTTVVIDVFRAFSTACYLMASGAARIIPVEHVEEALVLKGQIPNAILLGERNEKKVEGFDFGNSPTHIAAHDFRDKTIVMTTSSGTKGLMNATGSDEILSGSFVNDGATVRYLKIKDPSIVSLVCMGYEGKRPTQEDTFLAEYIRAKILDQSTDFKGMKEILRYGDGARLLDPNNQTWSPASDFDLCLDLDRFDFVLKLTDEDGLKVLKVTYI
ncbi:MAG: 2-phosphosulfolactate phosphatase [Prolixibacteraceae bacterium]|nr:2-phosphosulfolactate phosphatase [Prolixibacteraceae bacterium]